MLTLLICAILFAILVAFFVVAWLTIFFFIFVGLVMFFGKRTAPQPMPIMFPHAFGPGPVSPPPEQLRHPGRN